MGGPGGPSQLQQMAEAQARFQQSPQLQAQPAVMPQPGMGGLGQVGLGANQQAALGRLGGLAAPQPAVMPPGQPPPGMGGPGMPSQLERMMAAEAQARFQQSPQFSAQPAVMPPQFSAQPAVMPPGQPPPGMGLQSGPYTNTGRGMGGFGTQLSMMGGPGAPQFSTQPAALPPDRQRAGMSLGQIEQQAPQLQAQPAAQGVLGRSLFSKTSGGRGGSGPGVGFAQGGIVNARPAAGPPSAPPQDIQAMAAEQTAPLGQQAARQTMQSIDAAQDPESLINAIRGNQKPLEARYAELGQLVGPNDARATPASVLALVQPTLMLTQRGAMDSGVGELMQKLVGGVSMENPQGGAAPVAEGIGSLMTQGAGQEPQANFNAGPEIPGYQEGGAVYPMGSQIDPARYRQYLQELQQSDRVDIDKELSDARSVAQAQALFDIAQGGLALAAGSPQGGSFAQQAAAAFAPVAGSVGKRGAELFATERALKKDARAEDIAMRKLAAEMAKTPKQTLAEQQDALLNNPALAAAYGEGRLSPADQARVESVLAYRAREAPTVRTQINGEYVERRALPVAGFWQDAVQKRIASNLSVPPILTGNVMFSGGRSSAEPEPAPAAPAAQAPRAPAAQAQATQPPAAAPGPAPGPSASRPAAPAPTGAASPTAARGTAPADNEPLFQLEQAFGVPAFVDSVVGTILGTLDIQTGGSEAGAARAAAANLAEQTRRSFLQAYPGTDSNQLQRNIDALIPQPGTVLGGAGAARNKVSGLLKRFDEAIVLLERDIQKMSEREANRAVPGLEADRNKKVTALSELRSVRDLWRRIYDASAPQGADPVQRGRNLLEQRSMGRQ